jgi:hypothetical protein
MTEQQVKLYVCCDGTTNLLRMAAGAAKDGRQAAEPP